MKIKMYSALWCPSCVSAKNFLDEKYIDYEYIDITENEDAGEIVQKLNNGKRIIPTFIIDGKVYKYSKISYAVENIRTSYE